MARARFQSVAPGGARLAVVVLRPTRTAYGPIRIDAGALLRSRAWLAAAYREVPLPRGAPLRIELDYQGEPPALIAVKWIDLDAPEPDLLTSVNAGDPGVDAIDELLRFATDGRPPDAGLLAVRTAVNGHLLRLRAAVDAETASRTLDRVLNGTAELLVAGAAASDPPPVPGADPITAAYRAFFKAYDFATHAHLVPTLPIPAAERQLRCDALAAVGGFLWKRALAKAAPNPGPPLPLPPNDVPHVNYLSQVQIDVFQAHPPFHAGGAYEWAAIEDAFAQFACGRLAAPYGINNFRPDSVNMFLFAEFAWLAIEVGADAGFWSHLRRVFVAMQQMYIETYGTAAPKHGLELTLARMQEILDAHAPLTVAQLEANIVGNLQIGLPTPFPSVHLGCDGPYRKKPGGGGGAPGGGGVGPPPLPPTPSSPPSPPSPPEEPSRRAHDVRGSSGDGAPGSPPPPLGSVTGGVHLASPAGARADDEDGNENRARGKTGNAVRRSP